MPTQAEATARRVFTGTAAILLALAATAVPATAQRSSHADTTRLVNRVEARYADRTLVTREGDFALLLVGQDLYIQLTDRGMDEIERPDEDGMDAGLATRLLGAMLRAGVRELLDRAIVYPVSELGRAEYVEDRLVLEDHEGEDVMDITLNDRDVLTDFRAHEARAFARELRRRMRVDD